MALSDSSLAIFDSMAGVKLPEEAPKTAAPPAPAADPYAIYRERVEATQPVGSDGFVAAFEADQAARKQAEKDSESLFDTAAKGFKRGALQSQGLAGGFAALIGKSAENLFGKSGASDWLQTEGLDLYERKMGAEGETADLAENASLTDVFAGKTDASRWVADSLGYLSYQAAEAVATGGAGALLAKTVGKDVVAATMQPLVAKQIARLTAEEAAKKGARMTTEQIARKAVSNAATMAGAGAALFANNLRQEAGGIYPEALETEAKDPTKTADLGRVWASSLGASLVDTGADVYLGKKLLGLGQGYQGGYTKRLGKELAANAAVQGATEVAQTGIERFGAKQDLASEEALRDYVDSGGVGALGGGVGAPIAALHQAPPPPKPAPLPPNSPLQRAAQAAGVAPPAAAGAPADTAPPSAFGANATVDTVAWIDTRDALRRRIANLTAQIEMTDPANPDRDDMIDRLDILQSEVDALEQKIKAVLRPDAAAAPPGSAAPAAAAAPVFGDARLDAMHADVAQWLDDPQNVAALRQQDPNMPAEAFHVWRNIINNPATPLQTRAAALEQAHATLTSLPNFTMPPPDAPDSAPGSQPAGAAPGTAMVAGAAPSAVAAAQPRDDAIPGQATRIDGELPPGQGRLPAPPGSPPGPRGGLPSPDVLEQRRAAEAAYEAEFADLLKAEQLGAADAELQERQQALRDAEARLHDIQAAIDGNRAAAMAANRRRVLDRILADPAIKNHRAAFAAELAREGRRDADVITPEESARIDRFLDASAAFAQDYRAPDAPNEMDAAALGIKERRDPARPAPEVVAATRQARYAQIKDLVAKGFDTLEGSTLINKRSRHTEELKNSGEVQVARAAIKRKIDEAAHQAATSHLNDKAEPTEAQKQAGVYEKGHIADFHGLKISIENPDGSTRSGTAPDGRKWQSVMHGHYGHLVGRVNGADVIGYDKDHLDINIGPRPDLATIFVIDQRDPDSGRFDEHKVYTGYRNEDEARAGYLSNYEPGWDGLQALTPLSLDEFKAWIAAGGPKQGPLTHYLDAQREAAKPDVEYVGSGLRAALQSATRSTRFGDQPDPVAQEVLAAASLPALDSRLAELGMQDLQFVGAGASSIVFSSGNRVARIGLGELGDRPSIPEVLQAEASGTVGGLRYEIAPSADTRGITDADVADMAGKLAAKGYVFADAGTDNLGRIDGRLVVLDPGSVVKAPGEEPAAMVPAAEVEAIQRALQAGAAVQPKPSPAPALRVDVPSESWLQDNIDYAKAQGRNAYGVPYMGKVTASYRAPINVSVQILAKLRGQRGEQDNVRPADLAAIKKIMQETGKLPLTDRGTEYVPYIEVAHDGSAWVSEGNHRIMAAAELGWDTLPVEIRYFDGGERIDGPLKPETITPPRQEPQGPSGTTTNQPASTVDQAASAADQVQAQATTDPAPGADIPEPKGWRTSYGTASKYAEALGVELRDPDTGKFKKLPALVAAIDEKRTAGAAPTLSEKETVDAAVSADAPVTDAGPQDADLDAMFDEVLAEETAARAPDAAPAAIDEASSLESIFAELDSGAVRRANKARRMAAKRPDAAVIDAVQTHFHDLLIQLMEAGKLEVNGSKTLTEDNAPCL